MDIVELKKYFTYKPDTGEIIWAVSRPFGVKPGHRADRQHRGYRRVQIRRKAYQAHRVAFALYHGRWPHGYIDHINHDGLDNRISNLREASVVESNRNRRCAGATFNKGIGRWQSYIKYEGKQYHLGCFDTKEEAMIVHRKKSIELFKEFSPWNIKTERKQA